MLQDRIKKPDPTICNKRFNLNLKKQVESKRMKKIIQRKQEA